MMSMLSPRLARPVRDAEGGNTFQIRASRYMANVRPDRRSCQHVSWKEIVSACYVEQADLLSMCFVVCTNRLRCRLNDDLAVLLSKIGLCLRGEPHIPLLARTEDELLASLLEDKLRFVFREHMRSTVVLL